MFHPSHTCITSLLLATETHSRLSRISAGQSPGEHTEAGGKGASARRGPAGGKGGRQLAAGQRAASSRVSAGQATGSCPGIERVAALGGDALSARGYGPRSPLGAADEAPDRDLVPRCSGSGRRRRTRRRCHAAADGGVQARPRSSRWPRVWPARFSTCRDARARSSTSPSASTPVEIRDRRSPPGTGRPDSGSGSAGSTRTPSSAPLRRASGTRPGEVTAGRRRGRCADGRPPRRAIVVARLIAGRPSSASSSGSPGPGRIASMSWLPGRGSGGAAPGRVMSAGVEPGVEEQPPALAFSSRTPGTRLPRSGSPDVSPWTDTAQRQVLPARASAERIRRTPPIRASSRPTPVRPCPMGSGHPVVPAARPHGQRDPARVRRRDPPRARKAAGRRW